MRCKLTELKPGETGYIVSVAHHGSMRYRLQDMGFLPGAEVSVQLRGWRGGISAYGIYDSLIALRQSVAERIIVDI